jgi:hypothetical protein
MPSPRQFEALRLELLQGGVARLYIQRTLLELGEHLADLESAALDEGLSTEEAEKSALERLGSQRSIAAAILAHPELLDFSHRWPRTAECVRTAAMLAALPALPVMYCINRGADIARWGVASGIATLLVGSYFAWLNWMTLLE